MLKTVKHVENYVKISRCDEMFMLGMLKTMLKTMLKYRKTPSHFTARVEIKWQIHFSSSILHIFLGSYISNWSSAKNTKKSKFCLKSEKILFHF